MKIIAENSAEKGEICDSAERGRELIMVKTSIVVPVYNTQPYLEECFNSIFAQTQKEIEVIAVNDGSTDGSLLELERLKKKYPELIVINQHNQGPGQARNTGMELARGEYIYFCDSDDFLYDNNALEKCYRYAEQNQLDVLMFDARVCGNLLYKESVFDNRGNLIDKQYESVSGEHFIKENFGKILCPVPYLLYIKADILSEKNIYFEKELYYEDSLFYCILMMHARRVMYIPETYYGRRYRENSVMTSAFDKKHLWDRLTVAEKIEKLECKEEIKAVFHEIVVNIMKSSLELGFQNKLFVNRDSARKMYDTSKSICGNETFRELDILYQSSVICGQETAELKNMRDDSLKDLLGRLKFEKFGITIGVYGVGKEAERLFREYENFIGQVNAKLVYIMTNPSNTYFRQQKVVRLEDVANMDLEYILIASSVYEHEMKENVRKMYGNKFDMIKLYGDLRF